MIIMVDWPWWIKPEPGDLENECFVCGKKLSDEEIEENKRREERNGKLKSKLPGRFFKPPLWYILGKKAKLLWLRNLPGAENIRLCSLCRQELIKNLNGTRK